MAIACARVSPLIVNRLEDASSPSLTIGENDERNNVCCISLAMPSSLFLTTSTVIGSRRLSDDACAMKKSGSVTCEDEIAGRIDKSGPARLNERCRVRLLNDGRPLERIADRHRIAVQDAGRNARHLPFDEDVARPEFDGTGQRSEAHLVENGAAACLVNRPKRDDFCRPLHAMAINAVMGFEEAVIEGCADVGVTGLERDFERIGLADVANVGEVADANLGVAE